MSIFSGKCDVYDTFCMIGQYDDDRISNARFYIRTEDGKRHRLYIKNMKDLIPYFPYLIGIHAHSEGSDYIELSSSSFVDKEEEERMAWKLKDVKKVYNRLKRKKEQITEDKLYEECKWFGREDIALKEIIHQFLTGRKNLDLTKIHGSLWEMYRASLADAMMGNGYSEIEALDWCFNEGILGTDKALERYNKAKK